jgi:hypothetical protein
MRGEKILGNRLIFATQIRCLRSLIPPKREVNEATPCGCNRHLNFSNNNLDTKFSSKKDIFSTLDTSDIIMPHLLLYHSSLAYWTIAVTVGSSRSDNGSHSDLRGPPCK